jgi:hypothetical protein
MLTAEPKSNLRRPVPAEEQAQEGDVQHQNSKTSVLLENAM